MDKNNFKPPEFRKKTFFFLSILCSILINLTFLYLVNIYKLPTGLPQKDPAEAIKKTLIVKFNNLSNFITKKTKVFFRDGLFKKQKWMGRKLALSDLAINTSSINFKPGHLKESGISEKIGTFGDNTGFDELSIDGHNSVYHYINKTIERHIGYPDVFVDRGIEGIVQGRLVFSPTGEYLPQFTKLRSSKGHLKVHVARKLKELFSDPLPYDLHYVRHDYFMVDTTIRFVIRPYASREFHQMNNFANGRHMAILIEKRGINPNLDNEWMDLLVTLMQYAPMARQQPMTAEGVAVPLLQRFLTGDGPIKLKDGTVQFGMSTEEFSNLIQNIFRGGSGLNLNDVQQIYNEQINQLEQMQSEKEQKMSFDDYKDDPEWDEWAEH